MVIVFCVDEAGVFIMALTECYCWSKDLSLLAFVGNISKIPKIKLKIMWPHS